MMGEIAPPMDLEDSPYRVADTCREVLDEHRQRTPRGEFHGALLTVER